MQPSSSFASAMDDHIINKSSKPSSSSCFLPPVTQVAREILLFLSFG